jgi:Cu/Zn superoxide dismutase
MRITAASIARQTDTMRHPVLTTSWLVMVACVIGPLAVKGHAPIIRTGGDDNNDPAAAPDRGGGGRFSCGLME